MSSNSRKTFLDKPSENIYLKQCIKQLLTLNLIDKTLFIILTQRKNKSGSKIVASRVIYTGTVLKTLNSGGGDKMQNGGEFNT